jgi:hypothetical protein
MRFDSGARLGPFEILASHVRGRAAALPQLLRDCHGPDGPSPEPPLIDLTDQDQTDIVAFMKLR